MAMKCRNENAKSTGQQGGWKNKEHAKDKVLKAQGHVT